jgi:glycosyltransferase involved in cell wall biosynthesis
VSRFDAVLAINSRDAEIFRKIGVKKPIAVVPFVADAELLGLAEDSASGDPSPWEPPARPPRILFVGTEGSTNLDAIRFFRARVFPIVRRQVPSCRLRVVGQAARHLEPEPGVDRVGWVDCLAKEYREAAAVAVPLRMGSGLKTKVVEALAHGKALLTTSIGAQGVDLVHGVDAVVSDDPSILAQGAVRILTDDEVRRGYELRARETARRFFDPETAFAPLRRILGLEPRASTAAAGTPEPAFVR